MTSFPVCFTNDTIELECLVKDKSKRLTLTQVLEHPWIAKNCEGISEERRKSQEGTKFRMYSHQQPHSPKILGEVSKREKEDFGGY